MYSGPSRSRYEKNWTGKIFRCKRQRSVLENFATNIVAVTADDSCFPRSAGKELPAYKEGVMAHKKIERKKELDRRRHRRSERLKQRVREAKAATSK